MIALICLLAFTVMVTDGHDRNGTLRIDQERVMPKSFQAELFLVITTINICILLFGGVYLLARGLPCLHSRELRKSPKVFRSYREDEVLTYRYIKNYSDIRPPKSALVGNENLVCDPVKPSKGLEIFRDLYFDLK